MYYFYFSAILTITRLFLFYMDSHSNKFIIKIFFGIFISIGILNIAAAYANEPIPHQSESVQLVGQIDVNNNIYSKHNKRHGHQRIKI